SIEINGRVSSLLEVGTGFHPELTGRENVFLNGTLLGMKRKEVKARFDEIVDFSGVEKFIDTPVKHYISGMKVRLAFAVAAHLDPDILIIDEVLAVGDAEFQKKCLGKMEDVTGQGRTVLFVSHNLGAVKTLCRDGILLGQGQVLCHSNVNEVMAQYNQYLYAIEVTTKRANGRFDLKMHPEKTYDLEFGLQDVEVLVNGKNADTIESGSELEFRVGFKLDFDLDQIVLGFIVRDESMQPVIGINNIMQNVKLALNGAKEGYISVSFKELLIYRRGKFSVDLFLNDGVKSFDIVRNAFWFQVEEADVYHSGKPPEGELNLFFQPGIKFSIG
ncbi:MAG: ABC transporter ATP-binding protein, partial [Imperialibacter sp.]